MIIIIPGRFSSLNQFIEANKRRGRRKNRGKYEVWNAGNAMKQKDQKKIMQYLPNVRINKPVYLKYEYYEPNARRDKDNISGYFHKIFQDALVQAGILKNDGWKQIIGFSDSFFVDQKNPRIEIIVEIKK